VKKVNCASRERERERKGERGLVKVTGEGYDSRTGVEW